MPSSWTHLIRFIAEEDGQIHLGEVDPSKFPDVGLAILDGKKVDAKLVTGSIYDGVVTDKTVTVARVSSNLTCAFPVLPYTFRQLPNECPFLAPVSTIRRPSPSHPLPRPQLPRSCKRSEHAHSRRPRALRQAPNRA